MSAEVSGSSRRELLGRIVRQAWPVLVSQWAGISFGVLDTAMTGHASPADLAAMGLAASIYITVFVGLMGVVHALIPILAQHFGAGRLAEVGATWGQGIWLALALSACGGAVLLFPEAWLTISGAVAPQVQALVSGYLKALAVALPAALMFRTVYALGNAVSRPKVVMTINLAAVGVKALCNGLLIYGSLGLPALGAVGAGVSTAIASWFSLAAGLWVLSHDPAFARFGLRLGRPRWAAQRELLRLGLPMGGSYLVEVIAFTFMALLVAREGTFVTGGHQILANLAALCYMMPMALGVAGASLAAQAIGAQDPRLAARTGSVTLALALAGALLTAAIVYGGRQTIVGLYTSDAQVATVALALLPILPLFHLSDAMQCVSSYLLRTYKVALVPMLIQAVSLLLFGLVGGWWLAFGSGRHSLAALRGVLPDQAPAGASVMWAMAALGLALSAALLYGWYRRVALNAAACR